jgi:hypothetical protein
VLLFELLEVIDQALNDKAYRRRMTIRAIEDCIILLRLGLWLAVICYGGLLLMRFVGL